MKRLVSLAAAVMMAAALCACGGGDKDPPPISELKKYPENFTKEVSWDVMKSVDANFPFEQYVQDEKEKWNLGREAKLDWWFQFPWVQTDETMDKYSTLKPVKEITGIDAIGRVPLGSVEEAVNLMMATGDFPDLITLDPNHPLVLRLIEGGFVYTIDELAEKYDKGFIDEVPEEVKKAGVFEDGKWWGLIGVPVSQWQYEDGTPYNLGNQAYCVRHDIWQALGKPSIATPDDLYNTLKLFKQTYPTLGGKSSIGIVGYGAAADGTLITMGYSFGIKQYITVDKQTQEVNIRQLDPKYPEFVAYMNKLYREGLLDPEFFVKDIQQQMESLATNAFMFPWVFHALDSANNILRVSDPDSVFTAIPPMSATGQDFSFAGSSTMGGASITLIPKKCSDPEAAIRLARYSYSPAGSLQLYKGNPGEHYLVKDGAVYQTETVKEAFRSDAGTYKKTTGLRELYALVCLPLREEGDFEGLRLEYDLPNSYPYSYDSTNETYQMEPPPTSDAGIAIVMARSIGAQETAKAITAATASESAALVQKMQTDIRKVPNYDKVVEFLTTQYKKNVERFGEPKWGTPYYN